MATTRQSVALLLVEEMTKPDAATRIGISGLAVHPWVAAGRV